MVWLFQSSFFISNKNLCFLISKDETLIKTKEDRLVDFPFEDILVLR